MYSTPSASRSALVERPHPLAAGPSVKASRIMFPELTANVLESPLDDVQELKKQYSNLIIQIDRLRPALARVSPVARVGAANWTVTEVFGHLIDADRAIWWPRIDQILIEDRPFFADINAEAVMTAHHWDALPLEDVLAQLLRVRWNNAMRLNSLPVAAFERSGIDPDHGEITLAQILAILVANDTQYLGLVRTLLDSPAEEN